MRHGVAHRKLGRVTEHRIALLRNQAQALLRHETIETTVPKAKELRPYVERLISIAKRSLAAAADETTDSRRVRRMTAERLAARDVSDKTVVTKLFDTIAPRYATREGGYTRLFRLGHRRGDAAQVAQVELLGSEYDPNAPAAGAEAPADAPARGLRGRARAAVKRLRNEGAAADGGARPKRARKAAKKDE